VTAAGPCPSRSSRQADRPQARFLKAPRCELQKQREAVIMAGSRGHLRTMGLLLPRTFGAVAGLRASLSCDSCAVRLTLFAGCRMSTEPPVMSVDDLVDLFPQYPRSAVEDVLQRVGAAQAVETLLSFGDDVLVRSIRTRIQIPAFDQQHTGRRIAHGSAALSACTAKPIRNAVAPSLQPCVTLSTARVSSSITAAQH